MKKVILLIGFSLISISCFLYYNYYSKQRKVVWDFVPESALVVYDMQEAVETYEYFIKTDFGKGISKLDLWSRLSKKLSISDTSKYNDQFIEKFAEIQLLVSLHSISKESVDLVFYVDVSKMQRSQLLQGYINDLVEERRTTLLLRVYNNRDIFETKGDGFQFSFFIEDGVLIMSQTSFLIEDVIRTITSSEQNTYTATHAKSYKANKLKKDQGDFYINAKALDVFLKTLTRQLNIGEFANSIFMDVKVVEGLMSLSGFTYFEDSDFLNTLKDQKAIEISIDGYVPNTAYSVLHTGISDASTWYDGLGLVDSVEGWDTKRMSQWIGKELVLVNLNMEYDDSQGRLLFIDSKDVNDALNQLNIFDESIAVQSEDTVFYENYGGILIKELNVQEFPKKLFGEIYTGFLVSYYAVVDNYVVFSNSIESMHALINSIEQEDTWGRTLEKSQWMSNTLEEASLSYFFDYSQAIGSLKNNLNDTWKQLLQSNGQALKGIGMGAIQFSNIDGQFYTNMILQYDLEKAAPVSLNFAVESTTYLEGAAITKPFVVRNNDMSQTREILIQDSLKNIYLIDHKGSIVWKDSIGQGIKGDVYQIDYYKNKKLQYLFVAGSIIHLLDRNGDMVENFPLDVGFEINQVSVLDYDHTRNYRILVADKNGNLYIFDKEGNNLDGWKPRKMDQSLLTAPRHIRVRGKDAIVAMQIDGEVHVMNRRGEALKGFPILLENGVSGDLHIDIGRDFEHTIFSAVSVEGELIQFNLNGDIINKKQFYKPTKDTFFELVVGVAKSDFVIMRQNSFRLSLLSVTEKTIISKDYLTTGKRGLQYYDLGGDNSVYVVNDFVQGFGYLYNHEGKLLNNVPISNEHEVGLLINTRKNKTYVYATYQDQVSVYSY